MESGEYSDLTILCEDQKFSVQKVVVCSQSKVLAAAMKKGFKVMAARLPIVKLKISWVLNPHQFALTSLSQHSSSSSQF